LDGDLGVNSLDTSDFYDASDITWGVPIREFGHNEQLIGSAIAGRRDDVDGPTGGGGEGSRSG
jgi:aryl-alcohol dehydrogenase-like predicted oxidoreductase